MLKVGDRIGSNPVVIQVKQTADPGLLELVKERNALISAQAASLGTLVERRIIPRRSLGSRLRGTRIGRGLSNARTESKYRRLRGESRDKSK